nr:MAG TPA: hypothetical protein [Caudoviricetes sp.]
MCFWCDDGVCSVIFIGFGGGMGNSRPLTFPYIGKLYI